MGSDGGRLDVQMSNSSNCFYSFSKKGESAENLKKQKKV